MLYKSEKQLKNYESRKVFHFSWETFPSFNMLFVFGWRVTRLEANVKEKYFTFTHYTDAVEWVGNGAAGNAFVR